MRKITHIIGVDEAGRGPLAGPVAVGVALVPVNFDWKLIPGVNDSKKLSIKKREEIFTTTKYLKTSKKLDYAVTLVSAKIIDKKGIVYAINKAMSHALKKTTTQPNICSRSCLDLGEVGVKLDGGLKAPAEYLHQETIIKGDTKEKVIGLASIMAKVTRDQHMIKQARLTKYAPYNFDTHKGYGTKGHREIIAKIGLSDEHRASYCKNIKML